MEKTNEKTDYLSLLEARRYDPKKIPEKEEIIFTIQDKIIGTLQNYVVISGQAKAGKSTYISAIIASAFLPEFQDNFGIKLKTPKNRPKIGYIDTESSNYDFCGQMVRIRNFALKNSHPGNLDAYSLRGDSPKKIKLLIIEYLKANPQTSILVVDGFLDLCLDYNSETETRQLTNWFKKITADYNILLIGVLHLSKGSGETLGHLGSNTDRWAQSTLLVEKNKELRQFILKSKFLRSADDFDPICLMNFNGKLQQMPYTEPIKITNNKPPKK